MLRSSRQGAETLPMEFLGTCEDRGMSWCQIFSRHQEFFFEETKCLLSRD